MKYFVLAAAMLVASLAVMPKAEAYTSCTTTCYGNTCTRTCY